jgi:hypothetical protein
LGALRTCDSSHSETFIIFVWSTMQFLLKCKAKLVLKVANNSVVPFLTGYIWGKELRKAVEINKPIRTRRTTKEYQTTVHSIPMLSKQYGLCWCIRPSIWIFVPWTRTEHKPSQLPLGIPRTIPKELQIFIATHSFTTLRTAGPVLVKLDLQKLTVQGKLFTIQTTVYRQLHNTDNSLQTAAQYRKQSTDSRTIQTAVYKQLHNTDSSLQTVAQYRQQSTDSCTILYRWFKWMFIFCRRLAESDITVTPSVNCID